MARRIYRFRTCDLVIDGELQYVDQLWNRSLSCGDFVIRNSRFCGIRRYGNVFRAATGVIENNIYESCSSAAIAFVNETQYPNGLYCSDITIRIIRLLIQVLPLRIPPHYL